MRSGLTCLATYSLMPLIGWWLAGKDLWPLDAGNNLPSFFSVAGRWAYLAVAIAAAVLTFWLVSHLPPRGSNPKPRPANIYFRNISLETVLVLGPFSDHRELAVFGDVDFLRWIGVALFILGTAFRLWAGVYFDQAADRQKAPPDKPVLLVEGPFRRLRYPLFTGILVLSLGVAFVFRSWISVFALFFMLHFTIRRIKEEEQAAIQKFGQQWITYSRNSWRLLPYIY